MERKRDIFIIRKVERSVHDARVRDFTIGEEERSVHENKKERYVPDRRVREICS